MIKMQYNIPLAPLSTFGIGGTAKEYIQASTSQELLEVLRFVHKEKKKYIIFSGGSNVVFPDEGISSVMIHILGGQTHWNNEACTVDSGVMLKDVIFDSIQRGYAGLECLSGIPGTVSGAIVGNAGAYGHSMSEVVKKVRIFDGGKDLWISNSDCKFAYRDSIFKHNKAILLQAVLKFQSAETAHLTKISKDIIALRAQKYKPGLKCPGSFFKNCVASELSDEQLSKIDPVWIKHGKIPAGVLLEQIGAKGMNVGGIEVASFHGNLLLNNTGTGKASEVKQLAHLLKKKVFDRFGIQLVEEVKYF